MFSMTTSKSSVPTQPNMFAANTAERLRQVVGTPSPLPSMPVIGEQYRAIKLAAIVGDSALQARTPFDPERDDEDRALVESLASDGQRVPVFVTEVEGATPVEYTLLDGHRRVAALRHLNRELVKTIIARKGQGMLECDLITLTANIRKQLTPLEQARVIARLRERHSLTLDAIANKVGLSARYVSELKALLETDPAIQTALEKGLLKAKTALALGQAPREQQPELARLAAGHKVSEADAQRWVARMADASETPSQAARALGITTTEAIPSPVTRVPVLAKEPDADVPAHRNSQLTSGESGGRPVMDASHLTTAIESTSEVPVTSSSSEPAMAAATQSALTLLDTCFPELESATAQALCDLGVARSANSITLKIAGLLVLAGTDVEQALNVALPVMNNRSVRKLIAVVEALVDVRVYLGRAGCPPECAPMLVALSKQATTLKQAILHHHRTAKGKSKAKRSQHGTPRQTD